MPARTHDRHGPTRTLFVVLRACAAAASAQLAPAAASADAIEFAPPPQSYATDARPLNAAVGDLDGDGHADLAVVASNPDGSLAVLRGRGDGSFVPAGTYGDGGSNLETIAIADLDGDGDADVVVGGGGTPSLRMLVNAGDGTFPASADVAALTSRDLVAADFDGDGDVDLMLATGSGSNGIRFLRNQGNGTFAAPILAASGNFFSLAAGDLDADGDLDLVASLFNADCRALLNAGDGSIATTFAFGGDSTNSGRGPLTLADLDGDGDLDAARAFIQGGVVEVSRNDGDGGFGSPVQYAAAGSIGDIVAGDFDADGDLDVAVPWSQAPRVTVLANDGDATFGDATVIDDLPSTTGTIARVAAGNLDDDDADELVVTDWAAEAVLVYGSGDPCPSDFTNDGHVGLMDLTEMFSAWGACEDCPQDFDHDASVGFADLNRLLEAWGPCP